MAFLPDPDIRRALAGQAYRSGVVRLAGTDLSGCSHLVATRQGLFAVNRREWRLVAHGSFYGLTVQGEEILAFEACDRPRQPTARGRVIRFRHDGTRIVTADVVATGLDNGCHQIDLIDGRLCVVDTYNQRVLRFPTDWGEAEVLRPLPAAGANDWAGGYAHVNSLVAKGDHILLMLHNGADKTGRPSEIAMLDRDWLLVGRTAIDGSGCHGLAVLENGAILACGSFAGELVGTDGTKVPVGAKMTRGLSVGDALIAVGGSAFCEREARDDARGAVFFLDRAYRPLGSLPMPAAVTEVRRLDGCDRSLSSHLERIASRAEISAA